MGLTTINRYRNRRVHHAVAAAFWILVGIVAIIAFGDALALLAAGLALVATGMWIVRELEHRVIHHELQHRARLHATGVGSLAAIEAIEPRAAIEPRPTHQAAAA